MLLSYGCQLWGFLNTDHANVNYIVNLLVLISELPKEIWLLILINEFIDIRYIGQQSVCLYTNTSSNTVYKVLLRFKLPSATAVDYIASKQMASILKYWWNKVMQAPLVERQKLEKRKIIA